MTEQFYNQYGMPLTDQNVQKHLKAALAHTGKEEFWNWPCQAVGCSFGPLLGACAEIRFVVASRGCEIPTVAAGVLVCLLGRTGGNALWQKPKTQTA